MNDSTQTPSEPSETSASTQDETRGFTIGGQYIKDVSFENPNAPASLFSLKEKPNVDLSVDLRARRLQDDIYELELHINCKASGGEEVVFACELVYAGIFTLNNIPEDEIEPLLLIDCPFVLFPFARRVIADLTRDGGFPPLMLEPVDFHALYVRQQEQATAEEDEDTETA